MCFRRRGSNVLCVGSADDACGGWTSTQGTREVKGEEGFETLV